MAKIGSKMVTIFITMLVTPLLTFSIGWVSGKVFSFLFGEQMVNAINIIIDYIYSFTASETRIVLTQQNLPNLFGLFATIFCYIGGRNDNRTSSKR